MNYKFQVGELVRVRPNDIGLVTARSDSFHLPKYTILIGGITITAWEAALTKAGESNEL